MALALRRLGSLKGRLDVTTSTSSWMRRSMNSAAAAAAANPFPSLVISSKGITAR